MARTPDRRPGPTEEEEEVRFYANLTPPTVSGALNFDGDDFVFYDKLGYFNPRGGGIFEVSGGFANTEYSASFGSGSYAADIGDDVFFFVSGSPGSVGSITRGVAAFGGDLVVTGSSRFTGGLSGSLTKLTDGTSYLIAGTNVIITSQSNGSVTISATGGGGGGSPGGFDTYVQYNDGGSFGGDPNFTFNETTDTLTVTNLSGSLTRLSDGTSYLIAGSNVQIVTSSNGSIVISSSNVPGGIAGGALTGSYPNPGLANRPVLVFQPGGPSTSDNVFTTWPSLMAAFSGSTGQVVIDIDTTYGAATITSGTHDLQERAILQGARTDLGFPSVLTLPDGAVLKDPRIIQQLEIVSQGTSVPNFIITARGIVTFRLGYITTSGNQPLIRLSGTDDMILQLDELQIVNNTPSSAIIDISSATAAATIVAYRGALFGDDNVVSGVSGAYLGMFFDSSVTVGSAYRFPTNPNFSGTTNNLKLDNAPLVGYDDSLVSNSYGTDNVQGALDEVKRRQYFFSTTTNSIYTTSSVAIKGLESGIDSPQDKGTDVFFYVSGSLNGSGKSLFGGNVVVSGSTTSLLGLSGSLTKLADGTSYLIQSGNVIITSSSNGAVTIGTSAINSAEHAKLRQLIHLAEEGGPFEGFTAGSYREVLPTGDPFPTTVIWWEDSSKTKKIVEETVTYNSQKLITTDEWKVYNTDGVTVLTTATDTITYSGVFETNRTRTIT